MQQVQQALPVLQVIVDPEVSRDVGVGQHPLVPRRDHTALHVCRTQTHQERRGREREREAVGRKCAKGGETERDSKERERVERRERG